MDSRPAERELKYVGVTGDGTGVVLNTEQGRKNVQA